MGEQLGPGSDKLERLCSVSKGGAADGAAAGHRTAPREGVVL